MPIRDSQRLKFHLWNTRYYNNQSVNWNNRAILFDNIEFVINSELLAYGYPIPRYKYKLKHVGDYTINQFYEISLPKHAFEFSITSVCTLIGWCVFFQKSKDKEAWHGPTFCRAYAESLSKFTGTPVQDIINSMLDSNLKVDGAVKVTARILKKREKLKNRVQELDDAIKRGRDEFELFLQPIIGELEKARLDLEALEKTIYY